MQSLRISLNARQSKDESQSWLNVFTEVVPSDVFDDNSKLESHVLQPYDSLTKYIVQTKSYVDGELNTGYVKLQPPRFQKWDIQYSVQQDLSKDSIIDNQFRCLRKSQAMAFGPNNKAGASTFLKRFQEISDRYLRLEKMELQRQLMDGLRSQHRGQIAKAWNELQTNKRLKKKELQYLSKNVLNVLKDDEIQRLIETYEVKDGKDGLQKLAAERRASVLQQQLKDPLSKASIRDLRKASFDIGLPVNRPRETLEKQLEEVLVEGGAVLEPAEKDASPAGPSANEKTKMLGQVDKSVTGSPPKASLLQRLKSFAQSKSSYDT